MDLVKSLIKLALLVADMHAHRATSVSTGRGAQQCDTNRVREWRFLWGGSTVDTHHHRTGVNWTHSQWWQKRPVKGVIYFSFQAIADVSKQTKRTYRIVLRCWPHIDVDCWGLPMDIPRDSWCWLTRDSYRRTVFTISSYFFAYGFCMLHTAYFCMHKSIIELIFNCLLNWCIIMMVRNRRDL